MDEDIEPIEVMAEEDLGVDELGDSPYEPETMELLEDIEEDTKKKRRDVLVQERVISVSNTFLQASCSWPEARKVSWIHNNRPGLREFFLPRVQ